MRWVLTMRLSSSLQNTQRIIFEHFARHTGPLLFLWFSTAPCPDLLSMSCFVFKTVHFFPCLLFLRPAYPATKVEFSEWPGIHRWWLASSPSVGWRSLVYTTSKPLSPLACTPLTEAAQQIYIIKASNAGWDGSGMQVSSSMNIAEIKKKQQDYFQSRNNSAPKDLRNGDTGWSLACTKYKRKTNSAWRQTSRDVL